MARVGRLSSYGRECVGRGSSPYISGYLWSGVGIRGTILESMAEEPLWDKFLRFLGEIYARNRPGSAI
jgi:hypothetical protein